MRAHANANIYMYTCMYICIHLSCIRANLYTYLCMYKYIYIYIYTHVYIYIYLYVYVCMYVHTIYKRCARVRVRVFLFRRAHPRHPRARAALPTRPSPRWVPYTPMLSRPRPRIIMLPHDICVPAVRHRARHVAGVRVPCAAKPVLLHGRPSAAWLPPRLLGSHCH